MIGFEIVLSFKDFAMLYAGFGLATLLAVLVGVVIGKVEIEKKDRLYVLACCFFWFPWFFLSLLKAWINR